MVKSDLFRLIAWCALCSVILAVELPPPLPSDEQLLSGVPGRHSISASLRRVHSSSLPVDHNTPHARRIDQWHALEQGRQDREHEALVDHVAQLGHGQQPVNHAIIDAMLDRTIVAERDADRLVAILDQQIWLPDSYVRRGIQAFFARGSETGQAETLHVQLGASYRLPTNPTAPTRIAALARADVTEGEALEDLAFRVAKQIFNVHDPPRLYRLRWYLNPLLKSVGLFLGRRHELAPKRAQLVAKVRALERYVPALERLVGKRPPDRRRPMVPNSRWLREERCFQSVTQARRHLKELQEKREWFLQLARMQPAEFVRKVWHM